MRRLTTFLAAVLFAVTATAQTMNIVTGDVTWQFPASQAGDMTYTDGTTLTIMGKTFSISDITAMKVDIAKVSDNTVSIAYDGTSAKVTVAGNVAQYITAEVQGAHVKIIQDDNFAGTGTKASEIEYTLSGATTDGEFYVNGKYKTTVNLEGVTLTNTTPVYSGAAVNIANGKRIDISIKKGTTNTLTDCANPATDLAQKACLYVKGHAEFKGKGTLNVIGKYAHAIKSGEYMEMKNCTINIMEAVKDGISCSQYFLMESGELNITGTQDDGIQCDLDGKTSTGQLTDHEEEDSGNIYISDGTIHISATANAAKAIQSEGDLIISGGTITCATSGGGIWDSEKKKTKAASCLSADGNMTVMGGKLTLTSTGAGGKGINVNGTLTISGDADVTISTSGNAVVATGNGKISTATDPSVLSYHTPNYKSQPKGIKADGSIFISGGTISVTTTGTGGEGIESKQELTIEGSAIITCNTSEDGINTSSNITINDGFVFVNSSGGDGIDANGNLDINGGVIYAIGSGNPERSLDASIESGKRITMRGGTIIAIGNLEDGFKILEGDCEYTLSWEYNSWYALYDNFALVCAFKTPDVLSGDKQKLIVYTSSTPVVMSGSTINGGTEYFGGMAKFNCTVSDGSNIALRKYFGGVW